MRISEISASAHEVQVNLPTGPANIPPCRFVLCRIVTEEGLEGVGVAGQFHAHGVVRIIETEIAPLLTGRRFDGAEPLAHELTATLNARASTGAVLNALAATDIALWDLEGKWRKVPLWRILGGARSAVPAYVTFGLPDLEAAELVQLASWCIDKGFTRLKMVVAGKGRSRREDAARVCAVAEALPPEAELIIDANQGYYVHEALDLLDRLDGVRLAWFEEPIRGNDPYDLAQLTRSGRCPVAMGQMEGPGSRLREILMRGAVDILQPNPCFNGGITPTRKVVGAAEVFNVPIANGGGWAAVNLPVIAGSANGTWVEYHLPTWEAARLIFRGAPEPQDGIVAPSEEPGLGLILDEVAAERTRLS